MGGLQAAPSMPRRFEHPPSSCSAPAGPPNPDARKCKQVAWLLRHRANAARTLRLATAVVSWGWSYRASPSWTNTKAKYPTRRSTTVQCTRYSYPQQALAETVGGGGTAQGKQTHRNGEIAREPSRVEIIPALRTRIVRCVLVQAPIIPKPQSLSLITATTCLPYDSRNPKP